MGTQEIRQVGVERDKVWERMRQRQQGRCALAARHEDTWDTQPRDAVRWWHMCEKPACLPDRLQPSVNMHQFQSTTQAQIGKNNSCQEAKGPE